MANTQEEKQGWQPAEVPETASDKSKPEPKDEFEDIAKLSGKDFFTKTFELETKKPAPKDEPADDEATDESEPVVAKQDEPVEKPKPKGWQQIDYEKITDPETRRIVEERINRYHGQVKHSEQLWQQAQEFLARQQQDLNQVKKTQTESSMAQTERELDELQGRAEAAFQAGNAQEGTRLLRELTAKEQQHNLQKAHLENEERQRVQTEQQSQRVQQERQQNAQLIGSWQSEREYAQPGHPWFEYTSYISEKVEHDYPKLSVREKLQMIDQEIHRAATQQQSAASSDTRPEPTENKAAPITRDTIVNNVLGSSSTRPAPASKTKLTQSEKQIARKFWPKLPEAEAYALYESGKQD